MFRSFALSTTALAALSTTALVGLAGPAHATCEADPTAPGDMPRIVCDSDPVQQTDPVEDDRDNLTVDILNDAEVVVDDNAFDLTGDDVTVTNSGSVTTTDGDAVRATGDMASVTNSGSINAEDEGLLVDGGGATVINSAAITAGGVGVEAGANATITNSGIITSTGDRGVEAAEGLVLRNTGTIQSFEGAVRDDEGEVAITNGTAEITGALIKAIGAEEDDGEIGGFRGIRTRGFDAEIVNWGIIEATGEAVEGRDGFDLTNYGRIEVVELNPDDVDGEFTAEQVEREDGVQFGDGTLRNMAGAEIIGRDDGVDVDSGLVENHGLIASTDAGDGAAIDVDAVSESEDDDGNALPAPSLEIINSGTIEGAIAILYAEAEDGEPGSTASQTIRNSGAITGTQGTAIQFSSDQGEVLLELMGGSAITGDVLFGPSDDTVLVGDLTSGVLINSLFDGNGGEDIFDFTLYTVAQLVSVDYLDDVTVDLGILDNNGALLEATIAEFELFAFAGNLFAFDDLGDLVGPGTPNEIPLPGGLPLLAGGLAAAALLRRRTV